MNIYRVTSPQHPWATALPDLLVGSLALLFLLVSAIRITTFVPARDSHWIKDRFLIALSRRTFMRLQYLQTRGR